MTSFLRKLLLPFSFLFGLIVRFRNELYDMGYLKTENAGVPVISVGNLSAGGTGKTPMAAFILSELQKAGFRPAYLSRGYGRKTRGYQRVYPKDTDASLSGEESLMIARRFPDIPVAVCEDRVKGARKLLSEEKIQVIVLDDAFQHRKIYRDLDIVMLDACNLNPRLLPAGNGREPLNALYRAEIVIINKWTDKNQIPALQSQIRPYVSKNSVTLFCRPELTAAIQGVTHNPIPLSGIKEAVVFAGLGNNEYFEKQIVEVGIVIRRFFPFPDHHSFTDAELREIIAYVEENKIPYLLTTEKDYIRVLSRIEAFHSVSTAFHYVPMVWEWHTGKSELITRIQNLMAQYYPGGSLTE
ncbi:MAG: tetraacyldisaccharide 4'-kinase [Bacteroidia bacterium]|nr:tetraacyldisaccharide 4'-kinase [Bacteroidia bacterium]